MRTTIDWDSEEPPEFEGETFDGSALEYIRQTQERYPWELRRSSSGDGWHVIVYENHNDTRRGFASSMADRRRLEDDEKRVNLDQDRWQVGSPFLQVLYRRKYMDRTDFPVGDGSGYSTGLKAEVVEQSEAIKAAPEEERVKDPDTGRLHYNKLLRLVRDATGLSQAEIAEKTKLKTYAQEDGGISRTTVSDYERGVREVAADSLKRWLRRTARSRGIGHYSETLGGGAAAEQVRYVDKEDQRRLLVEYVDVPVDFDIGEPDREYGLLNIHTGTYNANHSDEQLHRIHNGSGRGAGVEKSISDRGVADQALAVLSPRNPKSGQELRLDDRNETFAGVSGWTRELDSVNYEKELLDEGEKDVYLGNLPNDSDAPSEPGNFPIFEIILWDDGMTEMLWHVIGLWTGSDPSEATILRDVGLGDWMAG